MKRLRTLAPLFGLLLLAAALITRTLRPPALELEAFSKPAAIVMPRFDLSLGHAALRGVVNGADGEPLAEALVKLTTNDQPVWTYTDAHGSFELVGLEPGSYQLLVCSRTHHLGRFDVEAPAEDLTLELDRPYGDTQFLPPIERAPLRGELISAIAGQDLAGYELLLRPALSPDTFGAPIERRALAAADGAFALPDLILGEYRVAVLPPWARGGSWPNLVATRAQTYVHEHSSDERSLAVPMANGELIGCVENELGDALQGALVLAHPTGAADRPWPPVATDSEGAFRVGDLPPGEYELEVRAGEAEVRLSARAAAGATRKLEVPPLATRATGGY